MRFADRLTNRVRRTTGGHRAYLEAVEGAFGGDVDYDQACDAGRGRVGECHKGPL